jgi:hypothetical protein
MAELTSVQQRVLDALSSLEAEGHAGWVHEIAEVSGQSVEDTEQALSGLLDEHDLVQEVGTPPEEDEPDLGPRYRVKQRP